MVILCGGQGTRLRAVVSDRPKPMAEINERPFLDLLLDLTVRAGFRRVILCTGHLGHVIENYYGQPRRSLQILFSHEGSPLGTGGAVKHAESVIQSSPFLVMNGDSFCAVDLCEFLEFHYRHAGLLSIVVGPGGSAQDYGRVLLNEDHQIITFAEKGPKHTDGAANAGIYLFETDVLSAIPASIPYSLERDLFPRLVERACFGYRTHEQIIDIGTPERYEIAKHVFHRRFSGRDRAVDCRND